MKPRNAVREAELVKKLFCFVQAASVRRMATSERLFPVRRIFYSAWLSRRAYSDCTLSGS